MSLPFDERRTSELPRPVRVGTSVHLVRFVRVRRARRYVLRIRPDGTLRVAVPPHGTLAQATSFVRSQRAWIERERAKAMRAAAAQPSAADLAALKKRAQQELPPRLLTFAARHGFNVTRVTVRSQRTLWGSCSRRRGSVSLNWRLIRMPAHARDYILLHELAHLRYPDHSRRFWKLLAAMCPRYRDAHRWLRRNGHML
ncbi:MAG TPA: M48 family metallopeptidase [Vicinamibacterales bacterium]|nr:M48 family metallopeptidase [Vicinamibacterales bacterium]